MSYRPGEVTRTKLDRTFPFKVDIPSPRGGLGRQELTMTVWCGQQCAVGTWATRPCEERETGSDPVQYLRFYFGDRELAQRFREAFGGVLREPKRRRGR